MTDDLSHDSLGNPFTASSPETVAAIDDFVGGFLSYETRITRVLAAAEAEPGSRLANIYAGVLYLFLESPAAAALARPWLERAEAAPGVGHPREQALTDLLRAWIDDDLPAFFRISEQILDQWPRDLATLKLHQYHAFNRGDFDEMLRIALKVAPRNQDVAHMHGMLAFAYEQQHRLDEAEAAARQALAIQEREPWAHHALAHVFLTQGRIDEGAAFLEDVSHTWTDLNSFMHTHAWWHLALFYLSQGHEAEALDLYDREIWGIEPDYSQDQVGAVSLLARLEFAGVEVGDRWDAVADYLTARATDTTLPFLSLQYLYGLARAGRPEADTLLAAIRARAGAEQPPEVGQSGVLQAGVWRAVAAPVAEALVAFTRGDHPRAIEGLDAGLPRLIEVGGSHAQRDLFEQIHLAALIGDGRWSRAREALEARRRFDPNGAPLNRLLAQAYDRLGLPDQAEQARARARPHGVAEGNL